MLPSAEQLMLKLSSASPLKKKKKELALSGHFWKYVRELNFYISHLVSSKQNFHQVWNTLQIQIDALRFRYRCMFNWINQSVHLPTSSCLLNAFTAEQYIHLLKTTCSLLTSFKTLWIWHQILLYLFYECVKEPGLITLIPGEVGWRKNNKLTNKKPTRFVLYSPGNLSPVTWILMATNQKVKFK